MGTMASIGSGVVKRQMPATSVSSPDKKCGAILLYCTVCFFFLRGACVISGKNEGLYDMVLLCCVVLSIAVSSILLLGILVR